MKLKTYMLYVVSAMMLLAACNDMENVPTNKFTDNSYWTSEAKAQNVVNMAYSQMYDAGKMWSDESLSDNVIDGRTVTDQRAIRKGQATPSIGVFDSEWKNLYGGIKTCHVLLEKVDLVPNMNPAAKARMIAEIRFIRAAIYFRLVNFYGDVPFFTKDITLDEANSISRTSAATVLQFIHDELEDIKDDLPINTALSADEQGKITKGAVSMLQARVYLMEGNWDKVITYTDNLINNQGEYGTYDLYPSYRGLFEEENEYNQEVIMDRSYVKKLLTWGDMVDMAPLSVGGRAINRVPQQSLVDSYIMLNGKRIDEQGSNYNKDYPYANRDPRMTATIIYDGYDWSGNVNDGSQGTVIHIDPNTSTTVDKYVYGSNNTATGYYVRKYYSPQDAGDLNSGLNIITMRYADVLLMYAEAKFEKGEFTEDIWNMTIKCIRERAGFTDSGALEYPSLSSDDMRKLIRNERRCELAMEGLRWFDIKRWKAGSEYLTGNVEGATFDGVGTIRVDSYNFNEQRDYLWAVPQSQIDLNHNLAPNNPGYAN